MNFLHRSCWLRPDASDNTSAVKLLSHPVFLCLPQAVCNLQPLLCHVHFLDGSVKAIAIDPAETVASIMKRIQQMIQLQNIHGWALYEVRNDRLRHVTCCCHEVLQGSLRPQLCDVCCCHSHVLCCCHSHVLCCFHIVLCCCVCIARAFAVTVMSCCCHSHLICCHSFVLCCHGVLKESLQSWSYIILMSWGVERLCSQSCVVLLSWGVASVSAFSHVLCFL